MFEQFQGAAIESTTLQQPQISSNLPHQPYIPGDQIYGHCMHRKLSNFFSRNELRKMKCLYFKKENRTYDFFMESCYAVAICFRHYFSNFCQQFGI